VSKFGCKDAAKITKDILVFFPSFKNDGRPARRGDELLQMLLGQAAGALKEDLAPGQNHVSLEQSRVYLELSDFLCRERGAADPVLLLRFYCTSSLMGKMTLGRLSKGAPLLRRLSCACPRRVWAAVADLYSANSECGVNDRDHVLPICA
jgi:hypothetical protein